MRDITHEGVRDEMSYPGNTSQREVVYKLHNYRTAMLMTLAGSREVGREGWAKSALAPRRGWTPVIFSGEKAWAQHRHL